MRARLAAALAQDPAADRDDQAGLLGERDELRRAATRPRSGWRQRSSASTPETGRRARRDDRLVVQLELVVGDRALQVGAQLEAGEHALVHRAARTGGSRPCRRAWRCTSRRRRCGSARRRRRPSPARPSRCRGCARSDELLVLDAQRHGERLEDALGGRRPPPGAARRPRAARRTRRRRSARRCRWRGCSRSRRLATSISTWSPAAWPRLSLIVLKSSRSMKMTADAAAVAARAGDGVAHALGEQRAVGEARDRVVEGLVRELLLERLALADVAAVEDDAADVLVVEQVRVLDLELQRRCRRGGAARTRGPAVCPAVARGAVAEQVQQAACSPGASRRVEARADDLVGRVAERRARSTGSGRRSRAVGAEHGDEVARVLRRASRSAPRSRGGGPPRSARRSRARARPGWRARAARARSARPASRRATTSRTRAALARRRGRARGRRALRGADAQVAQRRGREQRHARGRAAGASSAPAVAARGGASADARPRGRAAATTCSASSSSERERARVDAGERARRPSAARVISSRSVAATSAAPAPLSTRSRRDGALLLAHEAGHADDHEAEQRRPTRR